MSSTKKKKSLKREAIEWIVFLGLIGTLVFTGLHVQVAGFLQGMLLKTGLLNVGVLPTEKQVEADYQFTLIDKDGKYLELRELKGKTIFINFWASWCPPCVAEMPDIHDLFLDMRDKEDIVFLMISVDKEPKKALRFFEKRDYEFPLYFPAKTIPGAYQSTSIPRTYVISPEGKVVLKKEGMASYDNESFRSFIAGLKQ